ncbi:MAG: hypothetical protein LBC87_04920, partial [Fibromonadaceae bacterium]|nr:hypothetical protein [Fibromonadaceae bacterium]
KCQEHTGAKKSLVGAAEVYEEEFAVLTNSNGKTHIYLAEIGLNCAAQDPKIFSINHAVDFDTLKLVGKYDVLANCGCTSSLDLTIESVGNDIKYLAYSNYGEDFTQIFPVRYKGKELKQP